MHQARPAAGLLDLIGNPIPVGGGFHRYLRSWLAFMQCCANRSRPVLHAILSQLPGVGLLVLHPRVMLVTIKGNIFFHARLLSFSSPAPKYTAARSRAFIFSFRPEQADAFSHRSSANESSCEVEESLFDASRKPNPNLTCHRSAHLHSSFATPVL